MRTTKIVATLGPASDTDEIVAKLIDAGVDIFRLNASHGTQDDHARRIARIREVSKLMGKTAGILVDLQGPKIRLGKFEQGKVRLEVGANFEITTDTSVLGNEHRACTGYSHFASDVHPGDRVLLADGTVELRVLKSDGLSAHHEVVSGGWIGDNKGINLPGVAVSAPSLTKKDMSDLGFFIGQDIDFIALSFVRKPADLVRLRLYLEEKEKTIPIIAKIEKPEAVEQLNAILEEADGVMVARGDLGVEMALEQVPSIQKSIIERARQHGKFVITATQMLESMIENPVPTRAEVSDIANAIYDGTDAVMLSAETGAGKYPVESVKMMARISVSAEGSLHHQGFKELPLKASPSIAEMIADGAYHTARTAGVAAIVVFTSTGSTARLIARYRPPVPIYAFTGSEAVARQLTPVYGVRGIVAPMVASTDEMLAQMDRMLLDRGWMKIRDLVVMVAGQPIGRSGTTNLMKLHRVGELR